MVWLAEMLLDPLNLFAFAFAAICRHCVIKGKMGACGENLRRSFRPAALPDGKISA
jgi:hypothetical protein